GASASAVAAVCSGSSSGVIEVSNEALNSCRTVFMKAVGVAGTDAATGLAVSVELSDIVPPRWLVVPMRFGERADHNSQGTTQQYGKHAKRGRRSSTSPAGVCEVYRKTSSRRKKTATRGDRRAARDSAHLRAVLRRFGQRPAAKPR